MNIEQCRRLTEGSERKVVSVYVARALVAEIDRLEHRERRLVVALEDLANAAKQFADSDPSETHHDGIERRFDEAIARAREEAAREKGSS